MGIAPTIPRSAHLVHLFMVEIRGEYTAVAVCNLAVLPLCLPPYLVILWNFCVQKEFQNILAYTIMFSMGAMDCLYLISGFQAGLMTLCWEHHEIWLLNSGSNILLLTSNEQATGDPQIQEQPAKGFFLQGMLR
uniref:G_PROTEIN_RECEP_F1_2 domain-containing protein n=1 Tax=Steinernema glaseri TaxID=37863 RepID=A0A1I7ZSJ2_9BILA